MFLATSVTSALAADPTGDWKVADGVANIRVAQCNGNIWGAVAWEKTPGGRDTHNPDASKQSRPTLGMPILIDMKKKPGVDAWEGQVYNAKDGQLYSSTIKPVGTDQLENSRLRARLPVRRRDLDPRRIRQIPSSPSNSMAKGPAKNPGANPAAPKVGTTATAPGLTPAPGAPGAPKTTGAVTPAPGQKPGAGQKQAAADPVGDICLLPDIARFAH